jgi:AraC family transcriptional regulator
MDYAIESGRRGTGGATPQNAWVVENELRAPGVAVQICTLNSARAEDVIVAEASHVIGLSLSAMPQYSQGQYRPDLASSRFGDFGRLVFRPADVVLRSRNSGGPHRTIRCAYDKTYLYGLTGLDDDWDGWKLAACLDMRGTHINETLLRLVREVSAPSFGSNAMAEGLTMVIAVELARYLRASPPDKPKAGGLALWQRRKITEFLQTADGTAPTAGDLATLCGISRGHLMRSFKASTGQTLHEHIEEVRLDRAKALLSDGQTTLKEIASMLGFSGPSSFSVAFRRACGLPPAAFRRRFATISRK